MAVTDPRRALEIRLVLSTLAFISLLCLASCPTQIQPLMLNSAQDDLSPQIAITSPGEGSAYQSTVTVVGTVADNSTSAGATGRVESLTYQIIETQLGGDIEIGEDGSFTVELATSDLSGDIEIEFAAVDWNGNSGRLVLTLVNDELGPYIAGSGQLLLGYDSRGRHGF